MALKVSCVKPCEVATDLVYRLQQPMAPMLILILGRVLDWYTDYSYYILKHILKELHI